MSIFVLYLNYQDIVNHINDFDGCCLELREQFSHPPKYIKKP